MAPPYDVPAPRLPGRDSEEYRRYQRSLRLAQFARELRVFSH